MLDAAAVDRAWPSQLARDIAHAVPVVSSSSLDEDALPLLADSPTKASAVVDEGRVVGLLRLEDVEHLVADLARRRDRA